MANTQLVNLFVPELPGLFGRHVLWAAPYPQGRSFPRMIVPAGQARIGNSVRK
jgi:hypothetical protein